MMRDLDAKDPVRNLIARDVVSVDGDATLRDVAGVLADEHVGAVLVEFPGRGPGVLTERDLVQSVADGMDLDETRAVDVMSSPLVRIDADDRIIDVALQMVEEDIRHIAVVERGEMIGIVSMRAALAVLASAVMAHW